MFDINVADGWAVAGFIKKLIKRENRIDHVFYTAGHHSFAAFELHDSTDGEFQFEVNLFGAMNVLRELALVMRMQKFGAFTLFSPGPIPSPHPMAVWHNACEAAIESMMQAAQLEFRQFGTRINHVRCGLQTSRLPLSSHKFIDHIGHAHAYDQIIDHAEQGIHALVTEAMEAEEIVALGVRLATDSGFRLDAPTHQNGSLSASNSDRQSKRSGFWRRLVC